MSADPGRGGASAVLAEERTEPESTHDGDGLLEMEGVRKVFVTEEVETRALWNVHLSVPEGQFLSVAGPSGCGKSTLLSVMGLLDVPTGGEYRLAGEPASSLTARERARLRNRHIGFVFQAFNLVGTLTVFENVELPLTYRDDVDAGDREDRVLAALDRVGMLPRRSHYPAQLSGGQQQRVAVARAVVGDPLVVLADEPTGNLDSRNGHRVMEQLQELHDDGATICMVTHDPRYADYAERTIHLFDGQIVEEVEDSGRALTELYEAGYEVER